MDSINKRFPIYLMIFIIFQPFLDIMTYFTLSQTGLSLTPGIIVRMFVLLLGVFYLYSRRNNYLTKKDYFYLVVYLVFVVIHFLVNFFLKDSFYLIRELTAIAKTSYFLFMFFIFLTSFREMRWSKTMKLFPVNISYAAMIINIVMLLATVTGTGSRSYGALYKIGHSGWFYAANDLGVILAIAFPLILWATYLSRDKKSVFLHWVNNFLTMISLFTVGTKVGHLAVVLTLGILTIAAIYELFIVKSAISFIKIHLGFTAFLLIATLILTPYLPAYTNSTGQMAVLIERAAEREEADLDEEDIDESTDVVTEEEEFFGESQSSSPEIFDGVIFSGRSGFLELHQIFYEEAPLMQQVFGMGYAGNYEGSPKLIERDFHDTFYQFGVVGFIIYMIPFIYYFVLTLLSLLKSFKTLLEVKYAMCLSSIALGLGIGYLAGHALTAPAVSIYLSLVIAFVVVDQERKKLNYNE